MKYGDPKSTAPPPPLSLTSPPVAQRPPAGEPNSKAKPEGKLKGKPEKGTKKKIESEAEGYPLKSSVDIVTL